jgi:hypothetical protein
MDGMSDDRFEAWLREAAKEYNRPPDIAPREEMWEHVEGGGRSSEVRGRRSEVGGTPDSSLVELREQPLVLHDRLTVLGASRSSLGARGWSLAAAAVLLLAAGIGFGYWMRGGQAVPQTVTAPDTSTPAVAGLPAAQNPATTADTSAPGVRRPALEASTPRRLALGDPPAEITSPAATTPTGYDVLATQALTAAEALLVSFRTSEDTALDDLMRRWSRQLLSTTRLLMASPAASDAQRRRLLEDLELVLIQLAQLPATDAALERDLVKRAIARRQVLTRIRTSIPAGQASGT